MKYCDEIRLTLFRELEICAQNRIQNKNSTNLKTKQHTDKIAWTSLLHPVHHGSLMQNHCLQKLMQLHST